MIALDPGETFTLDDLDTGHRTHTPAQKLALLEEYEQATRQRQGVTWLRDHHLNPSRIDEWRLAREAGRLTAPDLSGSRPAPPHGFTPQEKATLVQAYTATARGKRVAWLEAHHLTRDQMSGWRRRVRGSELPSGPVAGPATAPAPVQASGTSPGSPPATGPAGTEASAWPASYRWGAVLARPGEPVPAVASTAVLEPGDGPVWFGEQVAAVLADARPQEGSWWVAALGLAGSVPALPGGDGGPLTASWGQHADRLYDGLTQALTALGRERLEEWQAWHGLLGRDLPGLPAVTEGLLEVLARLTAAWPVGSDRSGQAGGDPVRVVAAVRETARRAISISLAGPPVAGFEPGRARAVLDHLAEPLDPRTWQLLVDNLRALPDQAPETRDQIVGALTDHAQALLDDYHALAADLLPGYRFFPGYRLLPSSPLPAAF